MGMSMSMSMNMNVSMFCYLTLSQRLELRLQLLQVLYGEQYQIGLLTPCGHETSPAEVLRGFLRDPLDFTTACPACGRRYEPQLISFSGSSRIELPFYCELQALHRLRLYQLVSWTPEEISRQHPGLYRTLLVHCGSLKAAFAKIGCEYPHAVVSDWVAKTSVFFGRLSDRTIADCVGVSKYSVTKARKALGISGYGRP